MNEVPLYSLTLNPCMQGHQRMSLVKILFKSMLQVAAPFTPDHYMCPRIYQSSLLFSLKGPVHEECLQRR